MTQAEQRIELEAPVRVDVPPLAGAGSLQDALMRKLVDGLTRVERANYDTLRYPVRSASDRVKRFGRDSLFGIARSLGTVPTPSARKRARQEAVLGDVLARIDGLERLYALLGDEHSKSTLVDVLAYRILGHRHVRLARNCPAYHEALSRIHRAPITKKKGVRFDQRLGLRLDEFDVRPLGCELDLVANSLGIAAVFEFEQYAYRAGSTPVEVRPGDTVLDCGGCWGDSALYFAHRAGRDGKVVCFEFSPGNLPLLKENLERNRGAVAPVEICEHPVWDSSGERLVFEDLGPATRPSSRTSRGGPSASSFEVETIAIDDLVQRESLDSVGFIKMDIEGAELNALEGAEKTIRRFKPRLGISLYHSLDDFVSIPAWLADLDLGYRFFLDHFTIHQEETVLFAIPAES